MCFHGLSSGVKGWYLYVLEWEDIFVSCDVVFYESHFPFKDSVGSPVTSVVPESRTDWVSDYVVDWDELSIR